MAKKHQPTWTAMENATRSDFGVVMDYAMQFNARLLERLLARFELLDEEWTPYPVNGYQHSLQSATRASKDGTDEETIVTAL